MANKKAAYLLVLSALVVMALIVTVTQQTFGAMHSSTFQREYAQQTTDTSTINGECIGGNARIIFNENGIPASNTLMLRLSWQGVSLDYNSAQLPVLHYVMPCGTLFSFTYKRVVNVSNSTYVFNSMRFNSVDGCQNGLSYNNSFTGNWYEDCNITADYVKKS